MHEPYEDVVERGGVHRGDLTPTELDSMLSDMQAMAESLGLTAAYRPDDGFFVLLDYGHGGGD